MKRLLFTTLSVFGALALTHAAAQTAEEPQAQQNAYVVGEKVAATVNDDPISTFDVRQRMRLLLVTQGIQVPQDAMGQFQQQALRDLIEERLKVQEAERYDLIIPDEEVDQELSRIASSAGGNIQTLAQDLANNGIALSTLRQKIRAEKAWEELVRGRFSGRINVTEDEVEDTLTQLKQEVQQEQYLISEICMPLENQESAQQMFNVGMQMIEQMRQGTPFRALAQQFSACPTAARGGDVGWLTADQMEPEMAEVVTRLSDGNVSRPLPVDGMMKLIALRQKREPATAGEPSYQVAYAGAPIEIGEEKALEALGRLNTTNACNSNTLSTDLGQDIGVTILPMLPEREFETVFHDVLAGLDEGGTSEVIQSEGAYHAIMLCEKDEGLGLPSKRVVENQLAAEELELYSRRYLRDVERDSAVQILLATEG